jgi:hypothetical protein
MVFLLDYPDYSLNESLFRAPRVRQKYRFVARVTALDLEIRPRSVKRIRGLHAGIG